MEGMSILASYNKFPVTMDNSGTNKVGYHLITALSVKNLTRSNWVHETMVSKNFHNMMGSGVVEDITLYPPDTRRVNFYLYIFRLGL